MNTQAVADTATKVVLPRTYEQMLAADLDWALEEASLFFEEKGAVNRTLREIARRLDELSVPYAVCGGLALFAHGYRRFTEDVDILVTAAGLKLIHEHLVGRGYLPPHSASKHLRDTNTKVKIEFLTSGQFPGDGKPKPIAFPPPDADIYLHRGVRYLGLKTLIELKLASGMTGQARGKDLVDVQELIRIVNLPREFSSTLNPFVAHKFDELWQSLHAGTRNYVMILAAESLNNPGVAEQLQRMQSDGVIIDAHNATSGEIKLITTDPAIAAKYDMDAEQDTW